MSRRRAAEHAHPADRFAREIRAILKRDTTRSRRLMRNPLGGNIYTHPSVVHICNLMTQ